MSTYTLGSNPMLAPSGTGTPNLQQQPKLLEDALNVVKQQGFYMRKSIDSDLLFDAFKHASTMLSELRTSQLLPKYYYELYMALFDELRYLTTYLYEVHLSKTHDLSNLYELVQYATSLLPRLYLMITVGSVYMKVSNEFFSSKGKEAESAQSSRMPPVKEIMMDLLEMSRGVQHATRGLFLRYYLSGLTRDYLPDCKDGPCGNIKDSVTFVLDNFVEMNKLWVRLQHQGHSREREHREQERRELRLLVGSNLVRLSQLEEITLEVYQDQILPQILDEIVGCKDVIAQEYLLDVIIQAFPDEFHLQCLDMYLSAIAGLHPSVNVKTLVISLIDRFAGYAARVREERSTAGESADQLGGISDDSQLFNVFWEQVNELIEARSEFTIEDVISLFNSIAGLSLNCYPNQLEYVDRVLGMAKLKLEAALKANPDCIVIGETKKFLLELLLAPIQGYKKNILKFLQLPSARSSPVLEGHGKGPHLGGHFTDFLNLQPFGIRRKVAQEAVSIVLKAHLEDGFLIDSVDGVSFLFGELCNILVRDQVDGTLFGTKSVAENDFKDDMTHLDWEDIIDEQTNMAQLIHVIRCKENNFLQNALLLSTARDHLKESGDIRIRFTFDSLVGNMIQLVAKCLKEHGQEKKADIVLILKSVLSTIGIMGKAKEFFGGEDWAGSPTTSEEQVLSLSASKIGRGLLPPAEMSLQLYLMGATAANMADEEELCYSFFVEAFTVFEDLISESKAQATSIMQIISTLYRTIVFTPDNYEILSSKCFTHSARLLKRADQSRGLLMVSHLYWVHDGQKRADNKPACKSPKKSLECLQRALKIADSVMDHSVSINLFVSVLEKYLWFFERKNEEISASYINSLIEMILSNLTHPVKNISFGQVSLGGPLGVASKPGKNHSKILLDNSVKHLENVFKYIRQQKLAGRASLTSIVPDMDSGFQASGELLVALMGHTGDIFQADTFQIIGGFPSLHPAELAIMNEVALIGKDFAVIDFYLKDEDIVSKDLKRVSSFEMCLKYALERWLDEYKGVVVELEAEAMQQHKGQTVTVASILNRLKRYQYLFQQICSLISDLNQTEDQFTGIRLLNFLHAKMTHCGNPDARELYYSLLQSLLKLFTRKLAQLVLYSELQDPHNEFMVMKNDSPTPISHWDFYKLSKTQLPYFMNDTDADTVLFIAKTAYVLKMTGSTQANIFIEKYTMQLALIVQDRHVNTKALIDCLLSMKQSIGRLLFDVVTKNDTISNQLESFRAIYLTGQGSFMDEFLEQQAKLKLKMDASFVPINVNDLNQIFKKVFETTISNEKWAPTVSNKFSMIDSDQSVNGASTADVFGTSAYLEYEIKWPLSLVVKDKHVTKYNDIFYFFCTLKKTHRRLVGLNHHILNSKSSSVVPNAGFVLCSRELFFLNSLWSYIQMDLVDSQFNELIDMAKNESSTCHSLETLAGKHESALQKLVSGCFLESSVSSKKISSSIRDILVIINKTCSLVERSLDEYQRSSVTAEHYESLVKFVFLKKLHMQDAESLYAEAKKKATVKTFFGGNKLDEAADLFGRAGNGFKLKKQFKESGDAFMEQGKTLEKLSERDEASGCYINAAKSYKKEFPKEAVEALSLAVMILTEKGRFSTAANNQKQIAEIYEQDIGDLSLAMDAYEKAADWYSGEDSNAQANGCFLKVAQFAGTLEDYDRAIDLFERVASKSLDNNLTKWSVREYLFKAMICVLCLKDSVRSAASLEKYQSMDPAFKGTRECNLCVSLVQAVEEGDGEAFSAALQDFDKMTKLDEWKTSLLLRVKKGLDEEEHDLT